MHNSGPFVHPTRLADFSHDEAAQMRPDRSSLEASEKAARFNCTFYLSTRILNAVHDWKASEI